VEIALRALPARAAWELRGVVTRLDQEYLDRVIRDPRVVDGLAWWEHQL
jgi:hypothetical protein